MLAPLGRVGVALVPMFSLWLLAQDARATGFDLNLVCSPAASEGEAEPVLVFDGLTQAHVCLIYVANGSGASPGQVTVDLDFGARGQGVFDESVPGGRDPGARAECGDSVSGQGTFPINNAVWVQATHPGFLTGTAQSETNHPYQPRCFDYRGDVAGASWTFSLPAGESAAMRATFLGGYFLAGQRLDTEITATMRDGAGNILAADAVDLFVAIEDPAIGFQTLAFPMTASAALVGDTAVGTTSRGGHTGAVIDVYLPYVRQGFDALSWHVDDGFNPDFGDILAFDPDDLQLGVAWSTYVGARQHAFIDVKEDLTELLAGSDPLPFAWVAPNHLRLYVGAMQGEGTSLSRRSTRLRWVAAFSDHPSVQALLEAGPVHAGRACVDTEQVDPQCRDIDGAILEDGDYLDAFGASSGLGSSTSARFESIALSPLGSGFALLNAAVRTRFRDTRLRWLFQTLGDGEGRVAALLGLQSPQTVASRTIEGGPEADYAEDDLTLRQLALSDAPTGAGWVLLQGGGAAFDTYREFRVTCEVSRYGVRTFADECHVRFDYTVPRDARSSIDGISSQRFMANMSLGAAIDFEILEPDVSPLRFRRTLAIEVDARTRFIHGHGRHTPQQNRIARQSAGQQVDTTIGQVQRPVFFLENTGIDNLMGPYLLTVRWPDGYVPTAAPFLRFGHDANVSILAGDDPIPEARYTLESYDEEARSMTFRIEAPVPGNSLLATDQIGQVGPEGPVYDERARWVAVGLPGEFVPGVTRLPLFESDLSVAEITLSDGSTEPAERSFAVVPFRILGAPTPAITGQSDPVIVNGGAPWVSTLTIDNRAFDDAGNRLQGGATLSARDTVLFVRVPRAGDWGPDFEVADVAVRFEAAGGQDAQGVWVSADDSPPRAGVGSLDDTRWTFCAAPACSPEDVLSAGIDPFAVRWVAISLDELRVSDAEPRGERPVGGQPPANHPYAVEVHFRDEGSGQGARVRPLTELRSADTALLAVEAGALDVTINAACSDSLVGTVCSVGTGECAREGIQVCDEVVGQGLVCVDPADGVTPVVAGQPQDERCDDRDWSCDGDPLDGFPAPGQDCEVVVAQCPFAGVTACSADGSESICVPTVEVADTDGDGVADACDCAPEDDRFWTMTPDVEGSCDADGDGYCAAAIAQVNPVLCALDEGPGGSDCDDGDAEVNPGASERCDAVDRDCDGDPVNGFDVGAPCEEGPEGCRVGGGRVCRADGLGTECDAALPDDVDRVGTACTEGVGACAAEGVHVCVDDEDGLPIVTCDAVPGAPSAEVCDGQDNDCNGVTDDAPGTGEDCDVGVGQCAVVGTTACPSDGGSQLECVGEPNAPAEAERCDDLDWNCDGNPLDGFDQLGAPCEIQPGGCAMALGGTLGCAPDGLGYACVLEADLDVDTDGDGVIDACDCAPEDPSWALMSEVEPFEGSEGLALCDADGDGYCDADIDGPLNPLACDPELHPDGVGTDCDDGDETISPGASERCDAVDRDCDGDPTNGFDVGAVCEDAVAAWCNLPGTLVCAVDGSGTVCDTAASECPPAPCAESEGQPCRVGVGACARDGALVCVDGGLAVDCDASPGEAAPEACGGEDLDCDGVVDDVEAEDCSCDGVIGRDDVCPGAYTPDQGEAAAAVCDCATNSGGPCSVWVAGCVVPGTLDCPPGASSGGCQPLPEVFDADGDVLESFCVPAACGVPTEPDACEALEGEPCAVGVGECGRQGVTVCGEDGESVICSAEPGQPEVEVCDGRDNDCNGLIDDVPGGCDDPEPVSPEPDPRDGLVAHGGACGGGGPAGGGGVLWAVLLCGAVALWRRRSRLAGAGR